MPTNVLMPALSPTMTEGNLVKWNVKEGDRVRAGDVIAEIETDKATMEVEAVDEGVVGKLMVPEGTQGVQVNAVIAVLVEEGEEAPAEPAPKKGNGAAARESRAATAESRAAATPSVPAEKPEPRAGAAASPLAERMAKQAGIDLTGVRGSGPEGRITKADVEAALSGQKATAPEPARATDGRIFASPLARRLAAEAKIPLERLKGSGPHGRIVRRDIEKAVERGLPAAVPAAAAERAPAARPSAPAEAPGMPEFDLIPHTSMRKVIARRLTEAKQTIPHFYLTVDCIVDELVRARAALNERAPEGVKISVNDFVVKAAALALRRVPDANASWAEDGIRKYRSVDISVAVAIKAGLITPIIRNADQKGLAAISAEMKDLAARARDGKLKPEEFQGGTFSISNLGMYGIRQFDAVINPPQGAILAIGASEQRPVVKDGQLAIATVMTCTLSCDHRVVDGALGAELLGAFKKLIEYPAAMLL